MLQDWLIHEKLACTHMWRWIDSVPTVSKTDPKYQQAVELAYHLAACRHNWLQFMTTSEPEIFTWWEKGVSVSQAKSVYEDTLADWERHLAMSDPQSLDAPFSFVEGGETWSLIRRDQIMQLVGHGFYHRGQIALLVSQLGGETTDTDFIYWKTGEM
jgi:uncharacterized damage-inducible protein DinB